MTIADMTAKRTETIASLRQRLRLILDEAKEPLGLSAIEALLQKNRVDSGEPLGPLSTFDVRDAIDEMVEAREAKFTLGQRILKGDK